MALIRSTKWQKARKKQFLMFFSLAFFVLRNPSQKFLLFSPPKKSVKFNFHNLVGFISSTYDLWCFSIVNNSPLVLLLRGFFYLFFGFFCELLNVQLVISFLLKGTLSLYSDGIQERQDSWSECELCERTEKCFFALAFKRHPQIHSQHQKGPSQQFEIIKRDFSPVSQSLCLHIPTENYFYGESLRLWNEIIKWSMNQVSNET